MSVVQPSSLSRIATAIDLINDTVGKTISWLALFMVLAQFALVIMRYVFGLGSIFVQESVIYAHGTLFMVGAAYTLLKGGHVRVDIFYREASETKKAWVDLAGVIFFLTPFCILLWYYSYPYVASSWAIFESSRESSGIPAVYLLKTNMLIFIVLIMLQGASMALRSVLTIMGYGVTTQEQA